MWSGRVPLPMRSRASDAFGGKMGVCRGNPSVGIEHSGEVLLAFVVWVVGGVRSTKTKSKGVGLITKVIH
ncbi:hypothetical protein V5799_017927 [Amblyomma americanum]|uniref:Uncharacterized protein n=1 Tax=Amblyomma americanum TaxID=6943 RepID=A0AAQ4F184_AMBAM